jgi:hypothetical protein
LGAEAAVAKFTVRWPNGTIESFPGAAAGNLVRLVEGSGKTRIVPMPK